MIECQHDVTRKLKQYYSNKPSLPDSLDHFMGYQCPALKTLSVTYQCKSENGTFDAGKITTLLHEICQASN